MKGTEDLPPPIDLLQAGSCAWGMRDYHYRSRGKGPGQALLSFLKDLANPEMPP